MPRPPLRHRSASSETAPSTSSLSRRWPLQLFLPAMCSISTCIEDPLRRFWLMKTANRTRIAGTPIHSGARSLARSWRNGCGTCAWNWDTSFPLQNCARQNLPKLWLSSHHLPSSQLLLSSLYLLRNHRRQFSMALPNGHTLPFPEAFPVPLFPCKRMGRCVAPRIVPSIHKSADPSVMAPFGSCMPLVSVIAAPVPCERNVKSPVPASSLGG